MRFNNLSYDDKLELQKSLNSFVEFIGGKHKFLSMIESIREASNHPLTNKTGKFHFSGGFIVWGKEIYKDKIITLKNMIISYTDDNLLEIEDNKLQKKIVNIIKTFANIKFIVTLTKTKQTFEFEPFYIKSETNIEINPLFQIIFFDGITSIKKILDFK